MIDPPWNEKGGGGRGAQNHYKVMKTRDMPAVIRSCEYWDQIDESAHLYMWVTNTYLVNGDAFWLAKELGFKPKSMVTWVKSDNKLGIGYYFRGGTEHMLLCTRGKAMRGRDTRQKTFFMAPRGGHSVKPDEAFELVERVSVGPYLEIFSRRSRPGWVHWGDEAPVEDGEEANGQLNIVVK